MKVFKGHFWALNKNTEKLERYDYKPIIAETREEAENIAPTYVVINGEPTPTKDFERHVLDYFRNANIH